MQEHIFTELPFKRKALAYFICSLAGFFAVYVFFIQVAPGVMEDQLMVAFSISATKLGFLGAAFYWANSCMQVPAGILLDKFGSRKVLSSAVFIAALGTTLFAITDLFNIAFFGRLLVGAGSTIGFIGTYYLANNWFPHRYFSAIAGLMHFAASIGSMFGETPLAHSVNYFGWRETMGAIGIFTFVLAILYWRFIKDRPTDGTSYGIKDHETEMKDNLSLLDYFIYALTNKQVICIAFCGFLGWLPVSTVGAVWGVPFLMKCYGWTNTEASRAIISFWIGSAIGAIILCWLSEKIKSRKIPLFICFALEGLSSLVVMEANKLPSYIVVFALFMLGISVCMQTLTFCVVKDNVDPKAFSACASINNLGAMLSGAVAPILIGFILDIYSKGRVIQNISDYSMSDYQFAFVILPFAGLLGLIITFFGLKETRCDLKYEPIFVKKLEKE